jgi:hypothetical protein
MTARQDQTILLSIRSPVGIHRHTDPMTEDRHNVRTYYGFDRANVEVLIEGRGWVAGEVRMQWQTGEGAWWAEVQYRSPEQLHLRQPRSHVPPTNSALDQRCDVSGG